MGPFEIRPEVAHQSRVAAYERGPQDPAARPLRVYAVDPSVARHDGAIATLHVPYEPLEPGPVGKLLAVECRDGDLVLTPVDLENPRILIQSGLAPSTGNPAFHQQMVYAVASNVYATFRTALGRLIAWRSGDRLLLRPHVAAEGPNAVYDPDRGEIRFGYRQDPNLQGSGRIFACLSHDIVAHEMTHALIDGLRSRFTIPTNSDVLALHEGLADLVALFQRFLHEDVLVAQIRKVGAGMEQSQLLTHIALEFTGDAPEGPRAAVDPAGKRLEYNEKAEPHLLGNVLVAAVFDAFIQIYRRKTERYVRLTGPRETAFLPEELIQILAQEATQLARQFLNIFIRAIDYCPPVDVRFGEYLRALLTADFNLVRDDPWGYREAIIRAFAGRKIFADGVLSMSEDELLWKPPSRQLPRIPRLSFSELSFNGDPAVPASATELRQQAQALGEFLTRSPEIGEFGLLPPGAEADPPAIHSIRTSRRVGPDGQVLFDLIAEVTQRRMVVDANTGLEAKFFGGSTIVIGPRGEIRYVISKSIRRQDRVARQFLFQHSSRMWVVKDGRFHLAGSTLPMVHQERDRSH